MPGVRCTRGSGKKMPGVVPQVHRLQPAFPAQWFYGLFRALPGDRAFLPPCCAGSDSICRKLDASVGASDHTTSPFPVYPRAKGPLSGDRNAV